VPAARSQTLKEGGFRFLRIEMKRLRVELRCERLDPRLVE
jgi:hypothetical protein